MKRKMITLSRILKSGLTNFIRNAWLSVAAIAVMVITLTIVLFSVIANATFANTIQQITDKIDISVYLKDDATEEATQEIISKIESVENVKEVEYVSKEQAKENFINQNADDLDLRVSITQTGDNPIPATIRIKPVDTNKLEELNNEIKGLGIDDYILDVSYKEERKTAIDNIAQATFFLRRVGIAGVAVFAAISMLIIFNTIRMAIFNRREELGIMRLLGASTLYIRGPFVVETVLYGVIAAIVSVALCNSLFVVSSSAFGASSLGLLDIGFASQYFADNFWVILATQLGIGVLIGGVSSFVATRRYLKFKTPK